MSFDEILEERYNEEETLNDKEYFLKNLRRWIDVLETDLERRKNE